MSGNDGLKIKAGSHRHGILQPEEDGGVCLPDQPVNPSKITSEYSIANEASSLPDKNNASMAHRFAPLENLTSIPKLDIRDDLNELCQLNLELAEKSKEPEERFQYILRSLLLAQQSGDKELTNHIAANGISLFQTKETEVYQNLIGGIHALGQGNRKEAIRYLEKATSHELAQVFLVSLYEAEHNVMKTLLTAQLTSVVFQEFFAQAEEKKESLGWKLGQKILGESSWKGFMEKTEAPLMVFLNQWMALASTGRYESSQVIWEALEKSGGIEKEGYFAFKQLVYGERAQPWSQAVRQYINSEREDNPDLRAAQVLQDTDFYLLVNGQAYGSVMAIAGMYDEHPVYGVSAARLKEKVGNQAIINVVADLVMARDAPSAVLQAGKVRGVMALAKLTRLKVMGDTAGKAWKARLAAKALETLTASSLATGADSIIASWEQDPKKIWDAKAIGKRFGSNLIFYSILGLVSKAEGFIRQGLGKTRYFGNQGRSFINLETGSRELALKATGNAMLAVTSNLLTVNAMALGEVATINLGLEQSAFPKEPGYFQRILLAEIGIARFKLATQGLTLVAGKGDPFSYVQRKQVEARRVRIDELLAKQGMKVNHPRYEEFLNVLLAYHLQGGASVEEISAFVGGLKRSSNNPGDTVVYGGKVLARAEEAEAFYRAMHFDPMVQSRAKSGSMALGSIPTMPGSPHQEISADGALNPISKNKLKASAAIVAAIKDERDTTPVYREDRTLKEYNSMLAPVIESGLSTDPVTNLNHRVEQSHGRRIRVLDTGCGEGRASLELKQQFQGAIEIDTNSLSPIPKGRSDRHYRGDFLDADFEAAPYDLIYSIYGSHAHNRDAEGQNRLLAMLDKTVSLLAPGGEFFCVITLKSDSNSGVRLDLFNYPPFMRQALEYGLVIHTDWRVDLNTADGGYTVLYIRRMGDGTPPNFSSLLKKPKGFADDTVTRDDIHRQLRHAEPIHVAGATLELGPEWIEPLDLGTLGINIFDLRDQEYASNPVGFVRDLFETFVLEFTAQHGGRTPSEEEVKEWSKGKNGTTKRSVFSVNKIDPADLLKIFLRKLYSTTATPYTSPSELPTGRPAIVPSDRPSPANGKYWLDGIRRREGWIPGDLPADSALKPAVDVAVVAQRNFVPTEEAASPGVAQPSGTRLNARDIADLGAVLAGSKPVALVTIQETSHPSKETKLLMEMLQEAARRGFFVRSISLGDGWTKEYIVARTKMEVEAVDYLFMRGDDRDGVFEEKWRIAWKGRLLGYPREAVISHFKKNGMQDHLEVVNQVFDSLQFIPSEILEDLEIIDAIEKTPESERNPPEAVVYAIYLGECRESLYQKFPEQREMIDYVFNSQSMRPKLWLEDAIRTEKLPVPELVSDEP